MKAKFRKRIHDGLARVFASDHDSQVDAQWSKMADAISDIAMDIVTELTTKAQVAPGIPVVTNGSPTTQAGATVSPGKII
jgi:hypothetical protein